MLDRIRSFPAVHLLRLLPAGIIRRFARHQKGAAAVEFAFVAAPFLALTFAIIETALVFFAGQTLETAVSDASRLILTGQAQNGGFSKQQFHDAVCANLTGGVFDCNKVYVNVTTFNSFGAVTTAPPLNASQQLDTTNLGFSPGGPNCIVAVQLYYEWPIYVAMLGAYLSNLGDRHRLLVATSVFRNEPYGPPACPT